MEPNPQHAKRNPNLKIPTIILKTTIMVMVISTFLLLLAIAALAVLHPRRRRYSAATSPESHLPRFVLTEEERETGEREVCAVCLEKYREGDTCTRMPGCCHVYHSLCVDTWLSKVPTCPVCRTPVRLLREGRGFAFEEGSKVLWSV